MGLVCANHTSPFYLSLPSYPPRPFPETYKKTPPPTQSDKFNPSKSPCQVKPWISIGYSTDLLRIFTQLFRTTSEGDPTKIH